MDKKMSSDNIAKNEDVEFSRELADKDDIEAMNRMKEADERAEKNKNKS